MRFNWRQIWPWTVRGLLVLVLLRLPILSRPLIVLGAPQTVQTTHPVVCVHTRLTDEVEEWKIQHTLQLVREMGANTIVEYFPWAYYEGTKNDFDFTHPDTGIEQAENQGITVVARLGLVPAWARPDPEVQQTTDSYLDSDHYAAF